MANTSISVHRRMRIALVGRPNVGKSTLFNRLLGTRKAVVSSISGTTRDRVYGDTNWSGMPLTVIDTGGFEFVHGDGLSDAVQRHVRQALKEADRVVLVCDAQAGLLPADMMIVEDLRKAGKPVVLAINKADRHPIVPAEFFSLGIAQTIPISALHGLGIGELLDHLLEGFALPPAAPIEQITLPVSVAIVGRPNVGKSSLLNALAREERVIVNEAPGTTRDAIDTCLSMGRERITLIDTAGLRHRRKVSSPIDLFAMSRAISAVERCDVALVMLDATQRVARDDRRIVSHVCETGRGIILLVNKWDLVRGGNERTLTEVVRRNLPFASFAPVLAVSAKTGFQVRRALTLALQIARSMQHGLPDDDLLVLLQKAWLAHPPPRLRGRTVRLQQARWFFGRPPRVVLMTRPAGRLPVPYQRYLLKVLHAHPKLVGVPVRLEVRAAEARHHA